MPATATHSRKAKPKLQSKESDTRCNARKASGGYCGQKAGHGTDHPGIGRCSRHGGCAPLYQQRVAKLKAQAAAAEFGLPRQTDPFAALEEELFRSAGMVDFYEAQVKALEHDQMYGPVGGGQGAYPEHKPHVWIGLLNDERDRFRRIADTCIKSGIAQRRVEIAEQQAQGIASAIKAILQRAGVNITPDVASIVREEMLQLAAPKPEADNVD